MSLTSKNEWTDWADLSLDCTSIEPRLHLDLVQQSAATALSHTHTRTRTRTRTHAHTHTHTQLAVLPSKRWGIGGGQDRAVWRQELNYAKVTQWPVLVLYLGWMGARARLNPSYNINSCEGALWAMLPRCPKSDDGNPLGRGRTVKSSAQKIAPRALYALHSAICAIKTSK